VGRADKPIPIGAVRRRTVGVAALLAGVLTIPLALLVGVDSGRWLVIGLISGLAYNWPLKFTVLSPVPYLVSFGALAAFAVPHPPWWAVVAAALLGGGAHFVNVLPDLADDARTGVRGLPHRLGVTGCWLAGGGLLLGATATLVFGPPGAPSWAGLATLLAAALVLPCGGFAARRPGSRAAFRSVLVVALADVILLLVSGGIR
jgi:4-hydroxybenzoate polyprenyltransferase